MKCCSIPSRALRLSSRACHSRWQHLLRPSQIWSTCERPCAWCTIERLWGPCSPSTSACPRGSTGTQSLEVASRSLSPCLLSCLSLKCQLGQVIAGGDLVMSNFKNGVGRGDDGGGQDLARVSCAHHSSEGEEELLC